MDIQEKAQQFTDAVVSEVKAEMGRQGTSSRALGRLTGHNPQYISARLDGGDPKTRKRVVLTTRDLSEFAHALGLTEVQLVERAEEALQREQQSAKITELRPSFSQERAVAQTTNPDRADETQE